MTTQAKVNYFAVLVTAVAALVQGAVWYSPLLFAHEWMTLRGIHPGALADMTPPPGALIAEFVRCLVVAFALAHLVTRLGVVRWTGALQLGALLWIGFQAMAIAGSVIHENYPGKLYAIHAGDALAKTSLMTVMLGVWLGKLRPSSMG
ncbi:MAG: DUF1761 domain-containing protein [Bryobacteraceae bacterium]